MYNKAINGEKHNEATSFISDKRKKTTNIISDKRNYR